MILWLCWPNYAHFSFSFLKKILNIERKKRKIYTYLPRTTWEETRRGRPVDNRPSTNLLNPFVWKKIQTITRNMWHMTRHMWHVICETCDMRNSILMTFSQRITQSINYEGVCRTALATPGLLKLDGVGPVDNRPSTN